MAQDNDLMSLDEVKSEADPDIEVHALRRQLDQAKGEIRKMQADYGDLRGYFRDLDSTAIDLTIAVQPQVYTPSKETKRVSSPCVAVLHLTDWHYGAVQDPDEIEDTNEFSPEILEARIRNLVVSFVDWVEAHRTAYKIDTCVILDTGDNISGDIHRELSVTNAFPTPVQAFRCGAFLGEILCSIVPHFERTRMDFIVPDNHGRLTQRPQAKQGGLNTHNYVVGHVAKIVSAQQESLEFNIHYQNSKAVQVAGRSYLLTHGHDIKGWAGIPYYGIERKMAKEAMARMNEPDYNKFHRAVMGHFHAPVAHPWYWIGGSASGTDAYDHQQGRRSRPIQCAWIVHKVHGEFDRTEFALGV